MTSNITQHAIQNSSKHIFIIDDDESMRVTLKGMLEFLGYQVHVFESAIEFLKISIQIAPVVIITDMRMPYMSGVELQAELLKRGRQIPIIFISGESTLPQTISAMKQGAIEFLIKPFDRDQILSAIVRGLEQDAAYMHSFIEKVSLEEKLKSLAPREREVFELLALGFNNAQIQEKLQIALPTAKQYKSEVMRKLNFSSLAQIIALKNRHP
jgi:two-component system, LuxR family, response regulator FixJ